MAQTLWHKDAIIYQTHIKAFFDANGDGIGDFGGLIQKLDYIKDLGVNTIWLLPFYPSPLRDDGYDIQDYKRINSSYGSMGDVRKLIRETHKRDLRLITELVINHTSDQHPWFQRARRAKPGSAYRDYYVWSDTDQKYQDSRIIFIDTEQSNWTWDPIAKAYYWHRFYSHQPDLNFDNARVIEEVLNLLHYWLDMGIDGLRLDAIPYLIERENTNCENLPETHVILKKIRKEMDQHYDDAVLLAEANQWPEDTLPYFGDGDECHMAFHFPLMPRMYLALAQEDRNPITDIMRQTPEIPPNCQWAIFLRNHDELTLEMVTENERDYLWNTYAADRRMRINLGIRRRLAPLMDNDRRKIELLNSLLLSMPGTPVIYYGDEIGMGDNIFLGDRDGVRTPMQWSLDRNGGFSRANPQELYLPALQDPIYGYQAINVEAQTRSPSSLLNWMKRLINTRSNHKAFGRGTLEFNYPGNRKILAYRRIWEDEVILCVANLSRQAQAVELDLKDYRGFVPIELLGHTPFPPIGELPYLLTIPAYGFYWFILEEEAAVPSWHEEIPDPLPEFITLVHNSGWDWVTKGQGKKQLETQALPGFARNQRWFAAKDAGIKAVSFDHAAALKTGHGDVLLAWLDVDLEDNSQQRYLLPLSVAWGEDHGAVGSMYLPFTVAKVRRGPRVGVLYDATAGDMLARGLVDGMRAESRVTADGGELIFEAGAQLASIELEEDAEVRRLGVEQSNTSLSIDRQIIIKLYRRLVEGSHPEIEIGQFLTDVAGYANTPPYLGSLRWRSAGGRETALASAFGFVINQGDGWNFTLEFLDREIEPLTLAYTADPAETPVATAQLGLEFYHAHARQLGQRTGEMHAAFAAPTDLPAFASEAVTARDFQAWKKSASRQADLAFAAIKRTLSKL
ncbi:MAG: maltose alpha-D-glucosyltransferase, partial [Pseudomonadota bacterium]